MGRGGGVPLPSRLGGLGEHRKLLQRDPEPGFSYTGWTFPSE